MTEITSAVLSVFSPDGIAKAAIRAKKPDAKGRIGYYPIIQCGKRFAPECRIKKGVKSPCKDCPENNGVAAIDLKKIESNMNGNPQRLGIYPLLSDGTSHFGAFDIDCHKPEDKPEDVLRAVLVTISDIDIPVSVFKSGGGKGYHVYFFYSAPVKAGKTLVFLQAILDKANVQIPVEIFPKQERLKDLGNLIALPFHGSSFSAGGSCWIDPISLDRLGDSITDNAEYFIENIDRIAESKIDEVLSEWGISEAVQGKPYSFGKTSEQLEKLFSCKFFSFIRDNPEKQSYDQWRAMIQTLRYIPGGLNLIHKLSAGYPGYSQADTDAKIKDCDDLAPCSCQAIKRVFPKCEMDCGVKSPKGLLYNNRPAATATPGVQTTPANETLAAAISPFWYWDAKKEAVKISYENVFQFLIKSGFFNASFSGKTLPYRIVENRISMIDPGDIRRCVRDYLDSLPEELSPEITKQSLLNIWTAGIARYINEPIIQSMPKRDVKFHFDTDDKTFLYFRDGVLEISANGIKTVNYADLDGVIWESEILPYDLPRGKADKSHPVSVFFDCICTDPETNKLDTGRRESLSTVIGYLLHRYRDPSYAQAVILTDGCLDDDPNGGTGKGLLMKTVGRCRKMTVIDGKTHNPTNTFCLQRVDQDTRIILFDDVKKNFNFEDYFSMITEGFQVEGKNEKQIRFTPELSPKAAITTNFSVKGTGNSHDRRKFEMELMPFFNKERTPETTQGIGKLFSHWDISLWSGFFTIMAESSYAYHRNAARILGYKSDVLDQKKMRFEVGVSFLEFAEDIPLGEPIIASELMEKYKGVLSDKEKSFVNNTNFGLKIKSFCKGKGYVLTTDRNGHGKKLRYFLSHPEVTEIDP